MKALAKLIKGKLRKPNRLWRRPQIEGGGVRALAVTACVLAVVSGFALILSSGSVTHAQSPLVEITVEVVSGAEATYRARDNFATAGTWHYILLDGGADCDADAFSNAGYISSYTEGDDVEVFQAVGSTTICFRSAVSATNVTYTGYGSLTFGDNVGPRVTNVITYRPNAKVFNSDNIGDNLVIRVEFGEKVDVDYNGGLGPRLKTNVGTNRYAYIEDGTILRARTVWTFHLILEAGDNTADLDVLEWDTNGATVEDEAGNPFLPATADSYFPGHLAANHAVTVDTSSPVISVSEVVKNKVSATVSDNLGSISAFKGRILRSGAGEACDSSNTGTFIAYSGSDLSLSAGDKACFFAEDSAGNEAYALSAAGTETTPPTITVTPSTADSSPKRSITVTADSLAADLDSNSWRHKNLVSTTTCNAAAMRIGWVSGDSKTLNHEAFNGDKVCFAVKDTNGNWGYAASGVISGIDRTRPTISVSQVSPDNKVSAMASDNSGTSPVLVVAIIADNVCSSSTSAAFQSYTAGTDVTLAAATRACFRATDSATNVRYTASGVGVDLTVNTLDVDTTAPTITVTPAAADSSAKREIAVFASSSDSDVDSSSWKRKVVSASTVCDEAEMNSGTASGRSITFNSESYNNRKVCFAVKDTSDNWNYAASGVISGIDRTRPTISVSPVVDNEVSATASDDSGGSPTLQSQIIRDTICDDSIRDTFGAYTAGDTLGLAVGSRACFKATDAAGNARYAISGIGVNPDIGVPANDDTALPTIKIRSVSNTRVSASLTGDLSNFPTLEVLIISDNVCSDSTGGSFEAYTAGDVLTLDIGSRACFRVTDSANRTAYAVSAAGKKKKKRTNNPQSPPPRSPQEPQQPQLEVSVLTAGDTLSADDNYESGLTTMYYRIQSDDACDSDHEGAFNGYQEGTGLTPSVSSDYYVCFKSVDNDDKQNVAYSVSALIAVDIEDSQQPADDPVDGGDDDSDGETAIDPLPAPSAPDPGSDVDPGPDDSDDSSSESDSDDSDNDTDSSPSASESDSNRGDFLLALVVIGLPSLALVVVLIRRFFWQKN